MFNLRSTGEGVLGKENFDGKTILITGGTAGIGLETVKTIASSSKCKLVIGARNMKKGEVVKNELLANPKNKAEIELLSMNLNSFASVKEMAVAFKAKYSELHYLICNAGIAMGPWVLTEDGYEETFQVNHLSHFLLFKLLEDVMISSAPSRVVMVSSEVHVAHSKFDFPDASKNHKGFLSDNKESNKSLIRFYAESKCANILMAKYIGLNYSDKGVTAIAVHPGGVATDIYPWFVRWLTNVVLMSAAQGCSSTIYAMLLPKQTTFAYAVTATLFGAPYIKKASKLATNDEVAKLLWFVLCY